MKLARVVGKVVATIKDPALEGLPLLIIQPLDENQADQGDFFVAIDPIGTRQGDIVYWESSREAPAAVPSEPPVSAAIVGLVDTITLTVPAEGR